MELIQSGEKIWQVEEVIAQAQRCCIAEMRGGVEDEKLRSEYLSRRLPCCIGMEQAGGR